MKYKKYFLITMLILIFATLLCACQPKSTETYSIGLIADRELKNHMHIGEFRLASKSNDNYSQIYEILPQDKEDFIKFLQQSEYYIGNFKLSEDCYYLQEKNRSQVFKAGDECMWFAGQDYAWIGKFYANKFYYLTYFPMITIENDDIFIYMTEAIFSDDSKPEEVGVEYKCPLTWEQLKLIYKDRKIDEQNYSIELNCFIFTAADPDHFYGATQLYFNKDNNTVRVSSEYTPLEISPEEVWP